MKQFKTDEEQFRKFIIVCERLVNNIPQNLFNIGQTYDVGFSLTKIEEYKKELGMLRHPDAVKSDRYVEQEIPFTHD